MPTPSSTADAVHNTPKQDWSAPCQAGPEVGPRCSLDLTGCHLWRSSIPPEPTPLTTHRVRECLVALSGLLFLCLCFWDVIFGGQALLPADILFGAPASQTQTPEDFESSANSLLMDRSYQLSALELVWLRVPERWPVFDWISMLPLPSATALSGMVFCFCLTVLTGLLLCLSLLGR